MDFWSILIGLVIIAGAGWVLWQQFIRSQLIGSGETQSELTAKLARKLPLANTSTLPLKPGEIFVYEMKNVALVETRTGTRESTRTFGAATFRVAKGVYLTGGGGRTVSPPPPEEMREIDQGRATFTTKRIVFVGGKHTREWDFARLLGATPMQGGGVLMAVSNRQKMSGLAPGLGRVVWPWVMFQVAHVVAEDGFDAAKESLRVASTVAKEQADWVRAHRFASLEEVNKASERIHEKAEREATARLEKESTPDNTAATPSNSGKPYGVTAQELQVVGEDFYQDSFAALREQLNTPGESEHIVEAELRIDPDNPHSESGMAVAVFIRGLQVGHIPEALAPTVFEQIEPRGGNVTLGARLWLDHESHKPGKSSVRLFLDSRLSI